MEFSSSSPHPDRLWGPISLLSNRYREAKQTGREADHSPPLPHTSLWCDVILKYRDDFAFCHFYIFDAQTENDGWSSCLYSGGRLCRISYDLVHPLQSNSGAFRFFHIPSYLSLTILSALYEDKNVQLWKVRPRNIFVQNGSWEAGSHSASQEISLPATWLCHASYESSPQPHIVFLWDAILLSSHLWLCIPNYLFLSGLSTKICTDSSSLLCMLHAALISRFSICSS